MQYEIIHFPLMHPDTYVNACSIVSKFKTDNSPEAKRALSVYI